MFISIGQKNVISLLTKSYTYYTLKYIIYSKTCINNADQTLLQSPLIRIFIFHMLVTQIANTGCFPFSSFLNHFCLIFRHAFSNLFANSQVHCHYFNRRTEMRTPYLPYLPSSNDTCLNINEKKRTQTDGIK